MYWTTVLQKILFQINMVAYLKSSLYTLGLRKNSRGVEKEIDKVLIEFCSVKGSLSEYVQKQIARYINLVPILA